jgi:hypothetical protein
MKRLYDIPETFSFTFGKLKFGLWSWEKRFWWQQFLLPSKWSLLFTTIQFKYQNCTIYRKLEIHWLYHYIFQIILDK